jgi:hypothetical protein
VAGFPDADDPSDGVDHDERPRTLSVLDAELAYEGGA